MNTSGERLKTLLDECRLTAADFAAHLKVTPQNVNNWFHRGVPMARMDDIAYLLSVRSKWLRHGSGHKYLQPAELPVEPPPTLDITPASTDQDALLPLHSIKDGQLTPQPDASLRLPCAILDKLGVAPANAIALTLQDTCIAIDRSLTDTHEGHPYAVLEQGSVSVRVATPDTTASDTAEILGWVFWSATLQPQRPGG
jgi:hypothetical protein